MTGLEQVSKHAALSVCGSEEHWEDGPVLFNTHGQLTVSAFVLMARQGMEHET